MGGSDLIGLLGILLGLGVLIWFAFKGWSVLLLAPVAAVIAAFVSREPILAHWTQTFMRSGAGFFAQFFPLFLLGALFGKLMEDSGSVTSIANFMTEKLGAGRVILAVVLGGAVVTYGGVSLFVAFFVIAPMAQNLFRAAGIPRRLMPAAIMLGTATFTMSAMPGTPSIQNTIPMPFFGTTPFAAPGLGVIASLIMLGFGLWWLQRQEAAAKAKGEGFGDGDLKSAETLADDDTLRERASTAHEFDPAEIAHGTVAPQGAVVRRRRRADRGGDPGQPRALADRLPPARPELSGEARVGRDVAGRRHRRLVGDRGADLRHPDRARAERPAHPRPARHHGRRRQRLRAAGDQRGEPRRVRRGGGGAAGLRDGARRGARHRRRPAGVARGRDQHPGRADRLRVRRPDDRARRARLDLPRARGARSAWTRRSSTAWR